MTSIPLQHDAGVPLECLSIPIELQKEKRIAPDGTEQLVCGFKIGGGIDQDFRLSPHGYPDNGIYVTHVDAGGPADRAGIQLHDKILQVNSYDFTMQTHEKAVHYIKKFPVLRMLVARQGVPGLGDVAEPQPQVRSVPPAMRQQ